MIHNLDIDVDCFRDAELDANSQQQIINRMNSIFEDYCNIEIKFQGRAINSDSKLIDDDKLLHSLQTQQPSGERWYIHVLIARSYHDLPKKTFGYMYDHGPDRNQYRRGCAVFLEPHDQWLDRLRDQWLDRLRTPTIDLRNGLLARNIAHEVGHVLNLCHDDAGRIDAIMFDDQPYAFQLDSVSFSDASISHFKDHPEEVLRPGSAIPYGDRSQCGDRNHDTCGNCQSRMRRARKRPFQLGLEIHPGLAYPDAAVTTLVMGEPLSVNVTLLNAGDVPIAFDPSSSSQNGKLVLLVSGEGRDRSILAPPVRTCHGGFATYEDLPPGHQVTFSDIAAFRAGNLVFEHPGRYHVVARLSTKRGWLESEPQEVEVAAPITTKHATSVSVATNRAIQFFIETGTTPGSSARRRLRRLLVDNARFPANPYLRLALARARYTRERNRQHHFASVSHTRRLSGYVRHLATLARAEHHMKQRRPANANRLLNRLAQETDNRSIQRRVQTALI